MRYILVYGVLYWPLCVMAAAPVGLDGWLCCPSFLEGVSVDLKKTFSTSVIEPISKPCQIIAPRLLVLMPISTTGDYWQFAFVAGEQQENGQVVVHNCQNHLCELYDIKNIRQFKALQQYRWQPRMPQAYIIALLRNFIKQYKHAQPKPFLYTKILKQIDKIIVIGDLHGDSKSIRIILEDLLSRDFLNQDGILGPHAYIFFTGDYSDRGTHSEQVWAMIAHLKMVNPEHVFLLRGNHESVLMAKDFEFFELMHALLASEDVHVTEQFLADLFYSLPQAFIVGCPEKESAQGKAHFSFLLLCHGGIEEAVSFAFPMRVAVDAYQKNLDEQLIFSHELFSASMARAHPELLEYSGLLWSDFFASTPDHPAPERKCSDRGDWFKQYNSTFVRSYLEQQAGVSDQGSFSLDAIIRGHQHIPGGIARLLSGMSDERQWQPLYNAVPESVEKGSVYSCTSSPGGLGPFKCFEDSYALIEWTDAQRWQITPTIKTRVPKKFASLQEQFVDDCPTM